MKFSITSLLLAGLASTAASAPAPDGPAAATAGDTVEAAASKKFFLVVQSSDARVTGLCVNPYHTGAGTSTNQIQQCGPAPPKQYNFNKQKFKLNYLGYGSGDDKTKSSLRADPGLPYSSWGDLSMDAADPGTEFTYSKDTGFLQKGAADGLGFIACRWSHAGGWQLFALGDQNAPILASCAKVKLLKGCYNTDPNCVNNTF
ncbi:uncharacterized protein B0I36DRAFT_352634 [Microdochium trichocladiopsis]|uniref:DUF7907 domain-containing protein n=1 Tax=Microdochium trichocladiopsis TaxID=1682393 RepID=A0A9P8XX11_9PEZI|nr:uncharacterized protein B0I36DRAFT_352634 [Microdochium trichocladiopsis]KAH7024393.1 hypothetical protein B0I36DRAFT_352634 [Microdochium trichocladiopsis]